jgi:energy-coupling factor transporter ATP-binding protein EcfA2
VNLISFRDFSLWYSDDSPPALRNINLNIHELESVVVSGLSGSGKSTLCLAAAGLLDTFPAVVKQGEISRERKNGGETYRTAVVLQNFYAQISYLRSTVLEEIAFPCENIGLPREETARRVSEAIEKIRISHLARRNPLELSGGEKQKVVLAAALAVRPDLLVLDEPLSQLDPETTSYLAGVLSELKGKMALLIAENDPYLTLKVADRLVVLADGAISSDGRPEDVMNASTAEFLDLPAWTVCVNEAVKKGMIAERTHSDAYETNYRRALRRLRDQK